MLACNFGMPANSEKDVIKERWLRKWLCSFGHNSMTWQLGDQQHCSQRAQLTDEEVLRRAKMSLEEAEFVGFYATLDRDFWHLWRHYFPNSHSWLTSWVPLAFWVGTIASLPRLQVLKYTATTPTNDLLAIRARNQLDIALYDWAVARFRPGLTFYKGYDEWMSDHWGPVLAVAAVSCVTLYSCYHCCCCFLCRRRSSHACSPNILHTYTKKPTRKYTT